MISRTSRSRYVHPTTPTDNIRLTVHQPGPNEIIILGLSPSVDEDSIKVEGTGSAIISDIAVELLPNRDIFQEIYPDSDDDKSDVESDEEDDDELVKEGPALTAVRDRLTLLKDDQKRAQEAIANADSRLKFLDAYGKTLDRKRSVDIDAGLAIYRQEREKVFQDHMDGTIRARDIAKQIKDLADEEQRLYKIECKDQMKRAEAKGKIMMAKHKKREKEHRREAEKLKEKNRIRQERSSFWPRSCWSVRITLDAINLSTPSSSRRSSIASASDLVKVVPDKESSSEAVTYTCDLSLSYVVSSAWWSPSYDLSLSTTTNTATLCFDAQLTNRTSENWANCKIILSTSQATFAGIQDAIPTLVPWRVRLGGKNANNKFGGIIDSSEERTRQQSYQTQQNSWNATKTRQHLYGYNPSDNPPLPPRPQVSAPASVIQLCGGNAPAPSAAFGCSEPQKRQRQVAPGTSSALFVNPARSVGGALFGTAANANTVSGGLSDKSNARIDPNRQAYRQAYPQDESSEGINLWSVAADMQPVYATRDAYLPQPDTQTLHEIDFDAYQPELSFQETSFEETGLTTTYDLPGLKTLTTSSTASKQRVARVSFTSVSFSHTVVAKYKPVAYLKSKLHNASKLTLLKGPVGLTLDGSFMGRSSLPRCSAGDTFTLSLGIDPAIGVAYPKPDVKRSTSGLFTKEDSSVYTRSVTITNTRASAGKPINLVVYDQVPVSEDERLRIVVVTPKGMSVGGGGVGAGVAGKDKGGGGDWGRAVAKLRKGGEVSWDVVLNAGKSVKLALEYEVAVPGGDSVIQC